MRRFFPIVPCLAATFLAIGCASSGVSGSNGTSRSIILPEMGTRGATRLEYFQDVSSETDTVAPDPKDLWPRLGRTYASLSIPITTIDTTAHILGAVRASLIGHLGKRPLSYAIECGPTPYGTPRANSYNVMLTAVTQLTPAGTGTRVTTAVSAVAQDASLSSSPVQCTSTGALEREIVTALVRP